MSIINVKILKTIWTVLVRISDISPVKTFFQRRNLLFQLVHGRGGRLEQPVRRTRRIEGGALPLLYLLMSFDPFRKSSSFLLPFPINLQPVLQVCAQRDGTALRFHPSISEAVTNLQQSIHVLWRRLTRLGHVRVGYLR